MLRMNRRAFLRVGGIAACVLAKKSQAKPTVPSILWILLDQVCADSFGCYGHPFCKTPSFDRIAADGVKFTNACVAGMPCVPSRVSYNSGLYPHQTGVYNNKDVMRASDGHLARLLRKGGMAECILVSKDHFNLDPSAIGYTKHVQMDQGDSIDTDMPVMRNVSAQAIYSAHSKTKPEEMYSGRCVDAAVAEYERLTEEDKPFFMCLSINRPHPQVIVSSPFYEMYSSHVQVPTFPKQEELADKPDSLRVRTAKAMEGITPEEMRLAIMSHYGSLSEVDYNIGRLLDHVKPMWQAGALIIVVSADHGSFSGKYWLLEKGPAYRETACVPFIISQPSRFAPRTVESMVESIDLLPTLLDLCGMRADIDLPGVSLEPLLDGSKRSVKDAAYNENDDRKSVRTPAWHLSLYSKTNNPSVNVELYDLERDPHETTNLAYDEAHAAVVKELQGMIAARLGSEFTQTSPTTKTPSPRTRRGAARQ